MAALVGGLSEEAIVVGGGLAGLSAALRLIDRSVRVRLLEKRAILGGRAYSYRAREAGHAVDNGQHLLMGCYRRTLALLERIGASDRVEAQPRLAVPFLHPARGEAVFACAPLPSPLHLTVGAMRYGHLSAAGRARLLRGGIAYVARHLRGRGLAGRTVAEVLDELGQDHWLRTCFWDPLAVAALNELPERASAELFGEVLRRIFFAPVRDSSIVFPRVGLSQLFVEPAVAAIERRGGSVEAGVAVREVILAGGRVTGVRLHGGATLAAKAVIVAAPPPAAEEMLPPPAREILSSLSQLKASPIVSVHLWYGEDFRVPRMAGFLDGPIHWLFKPPMQPGAGTYVTLVTSGAHDLVERDPAEVGAIARRQLARYLPVTRDLRPVDSLVAKERAATFVATPEEQRNRPAAVTPIPGLFLAGDWTDTGLPATIESAIESGERAAEAVARSFVA